MSCLASVTRRSAILQNNWSRQAQWHISRHSLTLSLALRNIYLMTSNWNSSYLKTKCFITRPLIIQHEISPPIFAYFLRKQGLHNEELHNLNDSPNIISVIKSRRISWEGQVPRMEEMRNAYKIIVGKPRRRWEDNII
jgi:hypothetical protein